MTRCYEVSTTQKRLLGIGEDDVVRVRWPFVPVHLGRTAGEQAFDLARLVVRIQVEVEARRNLARRTNLVERKVRPGAVGRASSTKSSLSPLSRRT